MKRQFFALTAFLVFSGISVIAQVAQNVAPSDKTEEAPASATFSELEDLIHFGDLVEVDVVGSADFDWRGEINREGFLQGLRFTEDPVFALCKPGDEVAEEIRASYSRFLNDPAVKVSILDRSKRPMAVLLGAVRLKQRFRLINGASLRQLIVMSGGFTEKTEGSIEILRQPAAACRGFTNQTSNTPVALVNAETEFLTVGIAEILEGNPGADPEIFYGDLITVKQAEPVYVIGDVARPGAISYTEKLTLERAIDAAGGVLANLKSTEIRVFRRNATTTEVIRPVSTDNDGNGFELREYDIVEVFGGRGKRLEFPPVLREQLEEPIPVGSLPIRIVN